MALARARIGTLVVLLALVTACRSGATSPESLTLADDDAAADAPAPGATDAAPQGSCGDTWEEYGLATFTTTCASCHDHDHSAFTTRAGVLAQAGLITQRVGDGGMPKGAALSGAERQRLLDFVACGAPSSSGAPAFAYEPPSVNTAVAKVKNLLTGMPPTDAEIAAVVADPKALPGLVDSWLKLPQYTEKMRVFFSLAFQQTQITAADFVDLIPPNGINGQATALLVQDCRESFARTVLELDAQGDSFTNAFTTHRYMLTPALMEYLAMTDARHADNNGKVIDDWATAHPGAKLVVGLQAGPVPLEQTIDEKSLNFLHFYDADLAKLTYTEPACATDPIVLPASSLAIHDMLYGRIDGHKVANPQGGAQIQCPPKGGSLAATQLTAADFTTWKMVTIRAPKPGEATSVFYDLPHLRSASELVLHTPKVGFFSTPGFQANWTTNQSNQFRVTVNQAMIVATGMQYDGLDATPSPQTPGLDAAHAADSACFSCHRLLDPTRAIFSATLSWTYNQATDPKMMAEKGLFLFQGVTHPVESLDDFSAVLAAHPAVPAAWAQKLCTYFNSAPCQPDDPEFQRIVADFQQGFSWSTLVREMASSPLVTHLANTATYAAQGEVIAVTRRDHLCAALNARLKLHDACGQTLIMGANSGIGAAPSIASGLPSDGYGRGSTTPVLPNLPTLFYRAGVENICALVAAKVIDAKADPNQPDALQWTSKNPDTAIDDFTAIVVGLVKSDPRYAPVRTLLAQHFADAQKTANKTDALRSTFVTACLSPTLVGMGL